MFRENANLVDDYGHDTFKNKTDFLRKVFGIKRTSFNWDISLGDYRLLIIQIYKDREDYLNNKSKNIKYSNYFENGQIIEINNTKEWSKIEDRITLMVCEKQKNNDFEYEFVGFYKNFNIDGNKRFYEHLKFDDYDKILFCYPKYSYGKYIISLYYDSYRYDNDVKINDCRINPKFCISNEELNNSDYIFENMKLIAMEHADKKNHNIIPDFFDYTSLEEKLFKLAYSNIEPNLISDNDRDKFQKSIINESREKVEAFIKYMEE